MTGYARSVASGAAGALTLTAIHELVRRRVTYAPRMDILAVRGLRRLLPERQLERLGSTELHRLALAGDLVSNSLYYSAVAAPTAAATWARAVALGASAGMGALLLPERMGLGPPPGSHARANQAMTVIWYIGGALVAAMVANLLAEGREESHHA